MSVIEGLGVVIDQICDLRIPIRESELRESLVTICNNLLALKTALENAQEEQPDEGSEVTEDV